MVDRSWRQMLAHDGYVVIELRLHEPSAGGPKREISSGLRADWMWTDGPEVPVRAPIDVVTPGLRCIRPGGTGLVRAHPFQPEIWSALALGAQVQLVRHVGQPPDWYRVIGMGTVLDKVDLPDHPVPMRVVERPLRPGEARLRAVRAAWPGR